MVTEFFGTNIVRTIEPWPGTHPAGGHVQSDVRGEFAEQALVMNRTFARTNPVTQVINAHK